MNRRSLEKAILILIEVIIFTYEEWIKHGKSKDNATNEKTKDNNNLNQT